MSQPPYEPPSQPPNGPPSGPPSEPPNQQPPPALPGTYLPSDQLGPPPTAPPGYGAPMAPPPPPSKSRTGLIIGIVVGTLLAIGAVVLAVVLVAGSDSDSDEGTDSDDETTSASPSESESPVVPEGEVVQGEGYTYVLPDEWNDITADVTGQPGSETIDTTSAPGASLNTAPANLIVEVGPANGETDLESARDQVSANIGGAVGATPVEIDGPNIGGVATVGLEVTSDGVGGTKVLQTAYVTLLRDTYYVIGFSRQSGDGGYDDDFEAILDSWVWE